MNQHFDKAAGFEYSFRIDRPFWKEVWFMIACVALAAILAWYLIRRRDVRLGNLLRLKQERLSFEYEHLKSQVNPHFLFNSLNTLTGLIEEQHTEAATLYTERLSELYRNMLAYRDRDLIFLSEEWDILAAYPHIQRTRFEDASVVIREIPRSSRCSVRITWKSSKKAICNGIQGT